MEKCHNSHIGKKITNYITLPNTPPLSNSLRNSLINSDLIKFISSGIKKKINFTSVFDQKGSKNFLESKRIALQEILINEEIEFLEGKTKIIQLCEISDFSTKIIEENKFRSKNCLTPEKIFRYQNENTKSQKNQNKKNKKIKPMTEKFLLSYKIEDIGVELNINKKKRNKNCYRTQEIKMLKDKDIKGIEPIKQSNHNKSDKFYNFVKKDSEENDLSLFDLVSQL